MEHPKHLAENLSASTGVNVSHCYQCGKCSAGCALAPAMDYPPSYVIRLLQTNETENYHKILASRSIWLCVNCENCIGRCPKEIDIPKLMDYLREQSLNRRCVNKEMHPVISFHKAFLNCVKHTGRLYEIGLIAGFKMRTFRLLQDIKLVPSMLRRGKLNLLPDSIKNRKGMAQIFSKTIDNANKKNK